MMSELVWKNSVMQMGTPQGPHQPRPACRTDLSLCSPVQTLVSVIFVPLRDKASLVKCVMWPSSILSTRVRMYPLSGERIASFQKSVKGAYYRGGTSRAIIFQPAHLPRDRAKWPSIFRQVMGSGDRFGRQLDGLGAGISSLSKICLVEPYCRRVNQEGHAASLGEGHRISQDASAQETARSTATERPVDIDYTFVGLGIEGNEVDVSGNCGNMSSAIGPYAYNAGLLSPGIYAQSDGLITVRIRNTNTGTLMDSTFEVRAMQAVVSGDYTIDGVSTPGSKIKLDFRNPYGSKTGRVLPTGKTIDEILGFRVSCVDGVTPTVFIRADAIGVDGTILPNEFNKLQHKLDVLERIRKAAAVAMGIAPSENLVPRAIPKIGLVSEPAKHAVLSGQILEAAQMDTVVRFLSDTQPHRAVPLTAALTTAVAARVPGTLVAQTLATNPVIPDAIIVGHASGRLQVDAVLEENETRPICASVYRTAKRLFEGEIFFTDEEVSEDERDTNLRSEGSHSLGMAFVLESRGFSSEHLYKPGIREPKTKDMKQ